MSYEVELKFRVPDLPAFSLRLAGLKVVVLFGRRTKPISTSPIPRGISPARTRPCGCGGKAMRTSSPTKARRSTPQPRPAARSNCRWAGRRRFPIVESSLGGGRLPPSGRSPQIPPQGRGSLAGPNRGSSLDEVEGVGTFVEFELVADEADSTLPRSCIISLAQSLGLTQGERRSYLEMLLEGK